MALYEYKIATGWNNAAGLTNVEGLTVDSRTFTPPVAYMAYNPGTLRIRADGQVYYSGFPSVVWRFTGLTRAMYYYLMTTYTTGGNTLSGKVTISTRNLAGTHANYNAVMVLPAPPEVDRSFGVIRNLDVRFIQLVSI